MKTFQIIPDRSLDNKNVEKLAEAFSNLYAPPIARVKFAGKLQIIPKARAFWEIVLETNQVSFFLSVPEQWEEYFKSQIETCWPKVTVRPEEPKLAIPDAEFLGAGVY
jgi:hypothetical protein